MPSKWYENPLGRAISRWKSVVAGHARKALSILGHLGIDALGPGVDAADQVIQGAF
jgi:hypothetical protein